MHKKKGCEMMRAKPIYGMVTGIYDDPKKGKYVAVYASNKWYSFLLDSTVFKTGPDSDEPANFTIEKGNWIGLSDVRVHGKQKRFRAYRAWIASEEELAQML